VTAGPAVPCPQCGVHATPRRWLDYPNRRLWFYACMVCPRLPTFGINGTPLMVPPLWLTSERK